MYFLGKDWPYDKRSFAYLFQLRDANVFGFIIARVQYVKLEVSPLSGKFVERHIKPLVKVECQGGALHVVRSRVICGTSIQLKGQEQRDLIIRTERRVDLFPFLFRRLFHRFFFYFRSLRRRLRPRKSWSTARYE